MRRGLVVSVMCRECLTVSYVTPTERIKHTEECSHHPKRHRVGNIIAYTIGAALLFIFACGGLGLVT